MMRLFCPRFFNLLDRPAFCVGPWLNGGAGLRRTAGSPVLDLVLCRVTFNSAGTITGFRYYKVSHEPISCKNTFHA